MNSFNAGQVTFLNVQWDRTDVSPTTSIDVAQGYDSEGWPNWVTFRVNDLVQDPSGDVWRISAFTVGNLVLCRPHGLRPSDDIRSGIVFDPSMVSSDGKKLELFGPGPELFRHQDGLVTFG